MAVLGAARVTSFMLGHVAALHAASAKASVTAIGALLRLLHLAGLIPRRCAWVLALVPSQAGSDRVPESRASLREWQREGRRRRRAVALRLMLTLVVTATAAGSAWWWFQHEYVVGAEPEVSFMVADPGP